jgi:hypothetical protein
MATDRDVVQELDSDTFSSTAEVNRLSAALKLNTNVTSRLTALKSGWQEPDGPDRPTAIAHLESLKREAATVTQLADDLLALVPR